MSGRAHIIEIDRIVLSGADLRSPDQLNALIEAEVFTALNGLGLQRSTGVAKSEPRVAAEIAQTVVRSLQGGSDGV